MDHLGHQPGDRGQGRLQMELIDIVLTLWSSRAQYLPWDDNRPFNDGYLYNCLLIKARMEDEDQPHYRVEDLVVVDEVGG